MPYDPAVPLLGICTKYLKISVQKITYKWMFIAVLFTIGKSGINLNAHQWMNWKTNCDISVQRNIIHYKKEWSTDTCYKMHEAWKYSSKWNKPDIKDYVCIAWFYLFEIE